MESMPTHIDVPYEANPGNACALACYTMVARYLLPNEDITFAKLAKIADHRPGYVVWGFAVWQWLMDRGVHISDMDIIDYEAWSRDGVSGLENSVSAEEFDFYRNNTFDLAAETQNITLVFGHRNFRYINKKVAWKNVETEFNKPGICDLTLNSRVLNHREGLVVHRVVLLDISDKFVIFHDPDGGASGAYRREPIDHFRRSFESLNGGEIARYSLESAR